MAQGVKSEQKTGRSMTLCALRSAPCFYPTVSVYGYCLLIHRGDSEEAEGRGKNASKTRSFLAKN